jgi:hypothetical protein
MCLDDFITRRAGDAPKAGVEELRTIREAMLHQKQEWGKKSVVTISV